MGCKCVGYHTGLPESFAQNVRVAIQLTKTGDGEAAPLEKVIANLTCTFKHNEVCIRDAVDGLVKYGAFELSGEPGNPMIRTVAHNPNQKRLIDAWLSIAPMSSGD